MIDAQAISIVFAGISIGLAAIYYAMNIRSQKETRQAQLFMPIFSKFYDKEFMKDFNDITLNWEWKDFDDFMEKYGPMENPELFSAFTAWNDYFEGLGVLIKRNLIEASLIDDLISGMVMMYWDKYENIIKEIRVSFNYPQFSEYFEYLYKEIKSITEEQHPELKT